MGLFKKCRGCGKKERPGNSLQFSETLIEELYLKSFTLNYPSIYPHFLLNFNATHNIERVTSNDS